MQFLPVLPDSARDDMSQISSNENVAKSVDFYSWPSGWKDMRKSNTTRTSMKDTMELRSLKNEESFASGVQPLPIIGGRDALLNDLRRIRNKLKRQSKVYYGIGDEFPSLQKSQSSDYVETLDTRRGHRKSRLNVDSYFHSVDHVETGSMAPISGDFREAGSLIQVQDGNENRGFGVFVNGVYFEVHANSKSEVALEQPDANLNKHELKLQPRDRKAQEKYITERLTRSKSLLEQCETLQLYPDGSTESLSDSMSRSRPKTVTFPPDIGQGGPHDSEKHKRRQLLRRSATEHLLRLMKEESTLDIHGPQASEKEGSIRIERPHTDAKIRSRSDENKRNASGRTVRNTVRSDVQSQKKLERRRSPWKQKFQDRLEHINRRISAEKNQSPYVHHQTAGKTFLQQTPPPPREGKTFLHPTPPPPREEKTCLHPTPPPPRERKILLHPTPPPPHEGKTFLHPTRPTPRERKIFLHPTPPPPPHEGKTFLHPTPPSPHEDNVKTNSGRKRTITEKNSSQLSIRHEDAHVRSRPASGSGNPTCPPREPKHALSNRPDPTSGKPDVGKYLDTSNRISSRGNTNAKPVSSGSNREAIVDRHKYGSNHPDGVKLRDKVDVRNVGQKQNVDKYRSDEHVTVEVLNTGQRQGSSYLRDKVDVRNVGQKQNVDKYRSDEHVTVEVLNTGQRQGSSYRGNADTCGSRGVSRYASPRPGSKVAAVPTRRRDYVFQFSKSDPQHPLGPQMMSTSGSIEEWSVEYLGMDNRVRTDRFPPKVDTTYTLPRTFTRGRTPNTKPDQGVHVTLQTVNDVDSDAPVLLKVDSTKGYDRVELTTLPMIGTKRVDRDVNVSDSDNTDRERNRLYVGSTVLPPGKRKYSKKSNRLKRRFKKNKTTPTRIKNKRTIVPDAVQSAGHDALPPLKSVVEGPSMTVLDEEDAPDRLDLTSPSVESGETPPLNYYLSVKHHTTARSSDIGWGDNSHDEAEQEEEADLGRLIQVCQVNVREKDMPKKQLRPKHATDHRKLQRSPRPRHPKSDPQEPLPPIGSRFAETTSPRYGDAYSKHGETLSRQSEIGDRGEDEPKSRQEMRTGRAKPWMKPQAPQQFNLPRLQADANIGMTSSLAMQAREDISKVVSEIEKMRWDQEQYQEKVQTYSRDSFMSPRIVLISSRFPRCHSMKKAIKKDKNVVFIVYDFETWTFADILSTIRSRMDSYHEGCKMHSFLLLCGGGVGFCYLLKNFVMTPQKLQRADYAAVMDFWSKLGNMVSKLKPEESAINIMGCCLDSDKQGKEVLAIIKKAVHPNIVRVESPSENSAEGRRTLNQYFVYRRFLLWRSSNEEVVRTIGRADLDLERQRSWTELAEDAESDS